MKTKTHSQKHPLDTTQLQDCGQPKFCPCGQRARWMTNIGPCCDKCTSDLASQERIFNEKDWA